MLFYFNNIIMTYILKTLGSGSSKQAFYFESKPVHEIEESGDELWEENNLSYLRSLIQGESTTFYEAGSTNFVLLLFKEYDPQSHQEEINTLSQEFKTQKKGWGINIAPNCSYGTHNLSSESKQKFQRSLSFKTLINMGVKYIAWSDGSLPFAVSVRCVLIEDPICYHVIAQENGVTNLITTCIEKTFHSLIYNYEILGFQKPKIYGDIKSQNLCFKIQEGTSGTNTIAGDNGVPIMHILDWGDDLMYNIPDNLQLQPDFLPLGPNYMIYISKEIAILQMQFVYFCSLIISIKADDATMNGLPEGWDSLCHEPPAGFLPLSDNVSRQLSELTGEILTKLLFFYYMLDPEKDVSFKSAMGGLFDQEIQPPSLIHPTPQLWPPYLTDLCNTIAVTFPNINLHSLSNLANRALISANTLPAIDLIMAGLYYYDYKSNGEDPMTSYTLFFLLLYYIPRPDNTFLTTQKFLNNTKLSMTPTNRRHLFNHLVSEVTGIMQLATQSADPMDAGGNNRKMLKTGKKNSCKSRRNIHKNTKKKRHRKTIKRKIRRHRKTIKRKIRRRRKNKHSKTQ